MTKKIRIKGQIVKVPDDASSELIAKIAKSIPDPSPSQDAVPEMDMIDRAKTLGGAAVHRVLDPLTALPEKAKAVLGDISPLEAMNPMGKIGEGLALGMKDRYEHLRSEMGDSELAKAGAAIGSIPILGSAMDAGVKMFNPDEKTSLEGSGGILADLLLSTLPLAPEASGTVLKSGGKILQSPVSQAGVTMGAEHLLFPKSGMMGAALSIPGRKILHSALGFDPVASPMNFAGGLAQKTGSVLEDLQPNLSMLRNRIGHPDLLPVDPLVTPVPPSDPIRTLGIGPQGPPSKLLNANSLPPADIIDVPGRVIPPEPPPVEPLITPVSTMDPSRQLPAARPFKTNAKPREGRIFDEPKSGPTGLTAADESGASTEEVSRKGTFYKLNKSGEPTHLGKKVDPGGKDEGTIIQVKDGEATIYQGSGTIKDLERFKNSETGRYASRSGPREEIRKLANEYFQANKKAEKAAIIEKAKKLESGAPREFSRWFGNVK